MWTIFRVKLLLLLPAFILLWGCGTGSLKMAPNIEEIKHRIDKLVIVEPISNIQKLTVHGIIDDQEGEITAKQNIMTLIEGKLIEKYSVESIKLDTLMQDIITPKLVALISNIDTTKDISSISIDTSFTNLLSDSIGRYQLLVYQIGFTRSAGSYVTALAKGFTVGVLTLGTEIPVPKRGSSYMYLLLLDVIERKVVYFQFSYGSDYSPTSKFFNKSQVSVLLHAFLKD